MNISEHDLSEARTALGNILISTRALNASHDRLHKRFDELDVAHKEHSAAHDELYGSGKCAKGDRHDRAHAAHKTAHENARLRRLEHKSDHRNHLAKVVDGVAALFKVLGGGPESIQVESTAPEPVPGNRLSTAKSLSVNKNFRTLSPFDVLSNSALAKASNVQAGRKFANQTNPHWSGR